jgi:dephospho-CoA kinase
LNIGIRLNIGISGPIGAGKTTAAKYLATTYGLSYLRYSEVLAEISPGQAVDRESLRKFGSDIMSRGLQSSLNQHLLRKMLSGTNYVIDGLRHPIDFEALSKRQPFRLFYIDASSHVRWQRLKDRDGLTSWKQFQTVERHPVEAYLPLLRATASVLQNEGTILELQDELRKMFVESLNSNCASVTDKPSEEKN